MSEFEGQVQPSSVEKAETFGFSDGSQAKQTIPFYKKGAGYGTANVDSSGNLVVASTGTTTITGAVTCTQTTSPWVVNDTKNGVTAYDTRTITRDGNGNVATVLYKLLGVTQKTLTVTRDANLNITNLAVA